MAEILSGKTVAEEISQDLFERSEKLKNIGKTPVLAIVRVGENPGDVAYERGATKRSEKCGITVKNIILPESVSNEEMLNVIEQINNDEKIHGCLMLRPLPKHLDERKISEALVEHKDVDCMTRNSLATVFSGTGAGFAPCTARACIEILDHYGIDPKGKNITVVGRSLVVGKPLAMMLLARNATVTICHTKTVNLPEVCRKAEILVLAAGKAHFADISFTNPDQIVIDVATNMDENGKLCGDLKLEEGDEGKIKAYTPVPGGVGSVTSAVLCKHVIEAAERTM